VAPGQWLEGDTPILSLRQIAPAGFLTHRARAATPARSPQFVRQLSSGIGLAMAMVLTPTSAFVRGFVRRNSVTMS